MVKFNNSVLVSVDSVPVMTMHDSSLNNAIKLWAPAWPSLTVSQIAVLLRLRDMGIGKAREANNVQSAQP